MIVRNMAGAITDVRELKVVNTPMGETSKLEFMLKADSNSFKCIAFGELAKSIYNDAPERRVAIVNGELSNNNSILVNECSLTL